MTSRFRVSALVLGGFVSIWIVCGTYGRAGSLLLFVTLLFGSSQGLEWSLLFLVEALPLLTDNLANITYVC